MCTGVHGWLHVCMNSSTCEGVHEGIRECTDLFMHSCAQRSICGQIWGHTTARDTKATSVRHSACRKPHSLLLGFSCSLPVCFASNWKQLVVKRQNVCLQSVRHTNKEAESKILCKRN